MSYQDEDTIEEVEPMEDFSWEKHQPVIMPAFELDESGGELTEPDAPVCWHTKKKGA